MGTKHDEMVDQDVSAANNPMRTPKHLLEPFNWDTARRNPTRVRSENGDVPYQLFFCDGGVYIVWFDGHGRHFYHPREGADLPLRLLRLDVSAANNLTLDDDQWSLVVNALRVAALQYATDAETNRQWPRVKAAFDKQSTDAGTLADKIAGSRGL